MRRVVITGAGVVSPVGSNLDTFWSNIKAGKSGIDRIAGFDATDYSSQIAGEVEGFDVNEYIDRKEQRRVDKFCHYAYGASDMAMKDAGLDMSLEDPTRAGAIVGSGIGGITTLQNQHTVLLNKGPGKCSPFMIPQMITNMASGMVAIRHNLKGPNFAVVSACASAAHAIGDAMRIIRHGDADVMMAGGAEAAVAEISVAGFASMRALSTRNDEPQRASRPFDAERGGFVIAEGAGLFIVEELEHAMNRGAEIYCEIVGFGMTCDASHMTAPSEDGEGACRAMKMAMNEGGINPEDVSYINAHGTSTPLNDKTETRAIKGALGEDVARKVMISSSKSMTGHLLGAAAGIESAVCAMAIKEGVVSPTINYENPDPDCDLDYVPNEAREADVQVTLNNSLGFGGHNACLAFRKM
jgi:3-oxoacyl-[acyl-carrier-protein] synthase II